MCATCHFAQGETQLSAFTLLKYSVESVKRKER
jgi:hypothetical protein